MFVLGVDAAKGGWVVVALAKGKFAGAAKMATFDEVLASAPDAVSVGVDIPIGLMPEQQRVCDALAKERVGRRASSVFLMPPRKAMEAETYDEANAISRMLTEQGLSKQAYSLRAKIFEVEAAITTDSDRFFSQPMDDLFTAAPSRVRASLRKYARSFKLDGRQSRLIGEQLPGGRVVEVHPECSFREMAGTDLAHSKRTYNGMMKRRELLAKEGIDIPVELEEIGQVAVDDIFDAAAAAWTAQRYALRRAQSLPPKELWQWDRARPVAIWI